MIIGLLLFSCAEKEEPETIFGEYLPQSISSDKTIDMTGDGVVSMDLLDQLVNSRKFSGINSGQIFLNLYSPEYFNLHFSQVLLRLPLHYDFNDKVELEFHQNGRRIDLEENGSVALSWNSYPYPFDFPEQIHEDIVIESLKTQSGKNNNIELVTSQRMFDHSNEEWIEVKVTYKFVKSVN
jgi:hypothetical protein